MKISESKYYRRLCLLFFLFFLLSVTKGQEARQLLYNENIAPKSPEIAGLSKYGDIPVSEYTGTPGVAIPLYTLKCGDISFPITLNYHASGIRVAQEASWVGLGWDLMAGGNISYIIVGGNDQLSSRPIPLSDWNSMLTKARNIGWPNNVAYPTSMFAPGNSFWQCLFRRETYPDVSEELLHALVEGKGEQDYYQVNFLGNSFKFFFDPNDNTTPIFIGEKSKFKILLNSSGFTITDDNGNRFYFYQKESAHSSNGCDFWQSWYLTDIYTNTNKHLTMTYTAATIYPLPTLVEKQTIFLDYQNKCTATVPGVPEHERGMYRATSYSSTFINTKYISKIETDNAIVNFSISDRTDLRGAKKLDGIAIYDKLSNMLVSNYSLTYDYFVSSTVGGNFLNDDSNDSYSTSMDEFIGKRLKLNALIHQDASYIDREKHQFEYFEQYQLPRKTSFAIDFWGYYNGQENNVKIMPLNANHTILPSIRYLALTDLFYANLPENLSTLGANRGASAVFGSSGMLKSITYPTGGKTVFEYEPHMLSNVKYLPAETYNNLFSYTSYNVWDFNASGSQTLVDFTVSADSYARVEAVFSKYAYNLLKDGNASIVGPIGSNPYLSRTYRIKSEDQATYTNNGNSITYKDSLLLIAGSYKLICDCPSSITNLNYYSPVIAKITITNFNQSLYNSTLSYGGGMRIKNAMNYLEDNSLASRKAYNYFGGKLISRLKNVKVNSIQANACGNGCYLEPYTKITLLPTSFFETTNYSGGIVGYDKVEIVNLDALGNSNGSEWKSFNNQTGTGYFNKLDYFRNCSNGNLLEKVTLNSTGDSLKREKFQYAIIDSSEVLMNAYAEDKYYGPLDCCIGDGTVEYPSCNFPERFVVCIYPVNSYYNALKKKETTEYLQGLRVVNSEDYTYNLTNYKVKEVTTKLSNNNIRKTKITYPNDYVSENYFCSKMVGYNMISPEIEISEYIDGAFSQLTKKNFIEWYGFATYSVLKPQSIVYKIGIGNENVNYLFNKYDDQGNILSLSKENNVVNSYIWGYNNTVPVVKGENVGYDVLKAAVTSAAGIADLNVFWQGFNAISTNASQQTAWKSFNTTLRSQLPTGAMVTTYTYLPLVGMTSQTDANGITTYYEYDGLGRLKNVRDNSLNISGKYDYHYYSEPAGGGGGTSGGASTLSASVTFLEFDSSSGQGNVEITSNTNWTVTKSASWIVVSPMSSTGNGSISVSVSSYGGSRYGWVTLSTSDGTVSVTIDIMQGAI